MVLICRLKIHVKDIKNNSTREGFLNSLKNLKQIDLVLLHRLVIGWEKAWMDLLDIKKEGLVKEIGVSNFGINHLIKLDKYPKYNQIEISPFCPQEETVRFCKDNSITVIAHSSLVKGYVFNKKILRSVARNENMSVPQLLIRWGVQKGYKVIPRTSNLDHLRENWISRYKTISESGMLDLGKITERIITHKNRSDIA